MKVLKLILFCLPIYTVPWQTRQATTITVERYSTCTGLSRSECCEQMLRLSGYKSSREQLPPLAIQALRISCQDKRRVATQANCRGIAFSRSFSAKEVHTICDAPGAKRRCAKNSFCKLCTRQLSRLNYKNAYWTCTAVTWRRKGKTTEPKIISVSPDDGTGTSSSEQVIKYREVLH